MHEQDYLITSLFLSGPSHKENESVTILPLMGLLIYNGEVYGTRPKCHKWAWASLHDGRRRTIITDIKKPLQNGSGIEIKQGTGVPGSIDIYFRCDGYTDYILVLRKFKTAVPLSILMQRRIRRYQMTKSNARQNLHAFCNGMRGVFPTDVLKLIVHSFFQPQTRKAETTQGF